MLSPAGLAVLVLGLFSLNTKVQIGVRLVFPLMVFLHVMLAVAVCRRRNGEPTGPPTWLSAVAVGCLAWSAVEAALVWPDGVRYANRLHGGRAASHEYLSDSNADWGQGLPQLKRWWAANGEPPVWVWYYGTDPAVLMHPFLFLPVHAMPDKSPAAMTAKVGPGSYLAVGDTLLTSNPDRSPGTTRPGRLVEGAGAGRARGNVYDIQVKLRISPQRAQRATEEVRRGETETGGRIGRFQDPCLPVPL